MNVGDDWQNPLVRYKYVNFLSQIKRKMYFQLTYLSGFAKCDVCQCICDSYNEAESHRSIYAGIMEPKYPNL